MRCASPVPFPGSVRLPSVRTLIPFLMFCGEQHGKAEEAIRFYCYVFDDARLVSIDRYGPDEAGPQGTVRVAELEIADDRRSCPGAPAASW